MKSVGYPGLFFVMVVGNCGVPIGSELVLPAAGALAAQGHLSSPWLAGAVATLGEVAGGLVLYAVGYHGGHPFVLRYGRYLKLTEEKLRTWHEFYGRYGNGLVFVCRFIPLIRGVAALPAGVSQMRLRDFIGYTAAGSAVFCFGLVALGNALGRHWDQITPYVHLLTMIVLGLAALGIAIVVFLRARRAEAAKPVL